jgi:hypothetical protein
MVHRYSKRCSNGFIDFYMIWRYAFESSRTAAIVLIRVRDRRFESPSDSSVVALRPMEISSDPSCCESSLVTIPSIGMYFSPEGSQNTLLTFKVEALFPIGMQANAVGVEISIRFSD